MKRILKPRLALTAALGALAVGAAVLAMPTAAHAADPTPVPAFGSYRGTNAGNYFGDDSNPCGTPWAGLSAANSPVWAPDSTFQPTVGSSSDGSETFRAVVETAGGGYVDASPNTAIQDYTYFRGTDNHLHASPRCIWGQQGSPLDPRPADVLDLGGGLTSSPSAVTVNGVPFVFARGDTGELWYNTSDHRGTYVASARGGNHRIVEMSHKWIGLGGYFVGDPVAIASGNRIDVFVVNQNGELWDARSTNGGASFGYARAGTVAVGSGWSNIAAGYDPAGYYHFGQLNVATRECWSWGGTDPTVDPRNWASSGRAVGSQLWPSEGPIIFNGWFWDRLSDGSRVYSRLDTCAGWAKTS